MLTRIWLGRFPTAPKKSVAAAWALFTEPRKNHFTVLVAIKSVTAASDVDSGGS